MRRYDWTDMKFLAEAQADCVLKIRRKECALSMCSRCAFSRKFHNVYSQLSDMDKIEVDMLSKDYMEEKIESMKRHDELVRLDDKRKREKRSVLGVLVTILIALIATFFLIPSAHAQDYTTRARVTRVLGITQSSVRDVNNDGDVNCVDYALTFKVAWDKHYPSKLCEIVRNFNPKTGWHHLFVFVRDTELDTYGTYIEPRGTPYNFVMTRYWGDAYNPVYNRHGETEAWLKYKRMWGSPYRRFHD